MDFTIANKIFVKKIFSLKFKIQLIIEIIISLLTKNAPLKEYIIIESHNDFDSNGGAFYEYLLKNNYNSKYKIVWFLRNEKPKNLPKNVIAFKYSDISFRKAYYYAISKYIICGHWIFPSKRSDQKSYYTTHGGFGLKSTTGKINIPNNINYVLCPSSKLNPVMCKQYGLEFPSDKLISLGFPTHDILLDSSQGDLHKLELKNCKKIILWMPTFRSSVTGRKDTRESSNLGIPIFETIDQFLSLNEFLNKNDSLLLIKIHPMQDLSKIKIQSLTNILILTGDDIKELKIDNYRLMKDVDALISDYSSVTYDFLLLNKPIAQTMDDLADYKIGLSINNPEEYIAGPIINTFFDLQIFIKNVIDSNDQYSELRNIVCEKIWDYRDANNCKRLANHMKLDF